jgi:hypothetical protein
MDRSAAAPAQNAPATAHTTVPNARLRVSAAILAVAALVAGLAWWVARGTDDDATPRAAAQEAPSVPLRMASRPATARAAEPPSTPASSPHGAAVRFVCGREMPAAADPSLGDDWDRRGREAVRERVVAGLGQRGDATSAALAHLLAAQGAVGAARDAAMQRIRARRGDDALCLDAALQEPSAATDAGDADVHALLRQTAASREPAVHAMASVACAHPGFRPGATRHPACEGLAEGQWAALDPDNAVPWLRAAAAASAAGDAPGVEAALRRASHASTVRLRGPDSYAAIADALPEGASEADRLRAHDLALAFVAGWTLPPYGVVVRWCGAGVASAPGRAEVCAALARRLGESGETLMDLRIAAVLARRLDPASSDAARWSERADALHNPAVWAAAGAGAEPDDCAAAERGRALFRRLSQVGEVRALTERLAATGLGVAEAASQARNLREAALASAAASAAAASAASAAQTGAR